MSPRFDRSFQSNGGREPPPASFCVKVAWGSLESTTIAGSPIPLSERIGHALHTIRSPVFPPELIISEYPERKFGITHLLSLFLLLKMERSVLFRFYLAVNQPDCYGNSVTISFAGLGPSLVGA